MLDPRTYKWVDGEVAVEDDCVFIAGLNPGEDKITLETTVEGLDSLLKALDFARRYLTTHGW